MELRHESNPINLDLFSILPTELLFNIIISLTHSEIVRWGQTCHWIYDFTTQENLWKFLYRRDISSQRLSDGQSFRQTYRSVITQLRGLRFNQALIMATEMGYEHRVHSYLLKSHPNKQFAGNPRRLSRATLNRAIDKAAEKGYTEIFEELLEFDPRLISDLNSSVLNKAVIGGHRQIVDRIIQLTGSTLNVEAGFLNASYGGHLDLFEKFLALGAHNYDHALMRAAQGGHMNLISRIFELREHNYSYGLIGAAAGGHLDLVKFFMSRGATEIGKAFCLAADHGHHSIMKYLQSIGPRIEADYLWHAMIFASSKGYVDMVKELHEQVKGDLLDSTYYGKCLYQAATAGHLELVKFFHNLGVSADHVDNAICMASRNGHIEVLDYLRPHSELEAIHILWLAVETNQPKLVVDLIKEGVTQSDVEIIFSKACELGHSDVIERLLLLIASQPDLVTPFFGLKKYMFRDEAKQAGNWDVAEMIK